MDKEFKEIIIAAWLHDVGKFAQRADIKGLYNKELEGPYGGKDLLAPFFALQASQPHACQKLMDFIFLFSFGRESNR